MHSKYENQDSSIDFTDCFAYGKYKCNALTEMICKRCDKCPFYTPKHVYIEKIAILDRIRRESWKKDDM